MKKTLLLLVMTVSLSCQDEVSIETKQIDISQKDYNAQIVYTHTNLLTLGHAALRAAGDKNFRQTLYNEVEVQFDGDYNVLLEVLSNREASDKSKIGSRMASTKNESQAIDNAILAFKGIEGEDYHPQIYIPHYEDLKSKKSSGRAKLLSTETSPTLIIYTGDEEKEIYTGFKIDNVGELQEIATPVDEAYAQNNETWVLSLNESLISDCEFQEIMSGKANSSGRCAGGGGSGGGGSSAVASAIVDGIRIKCHKESWAAGASEVHMITAFSDYAGDDVFGVRVYDGRPFQGGRIKKVKRKDVRKESWLNTNFDIAEAWNDKIPDTPYAHYVIFEYDAWPTGKRDISWSFSSQTINWEYRSADGYYDKGTRIHQDDFYGFDVDNGCIEWEGQYQ